MREQRNKISFRGQKIYVGIDVHLKSWSVTVLSETSVLKKFSQHPSPEALYGFLTPVSYTHLDVYKRQVVQLSVFHVSASLPIS